MSERLAFHEEMAVQRDQRFTGWNNRKVEEWRREVAKWHAGDRDDLTREALKKNRWAKCECGRMFQPGERDYQQCFVTNQASYAEGSTACVICQRRHSQKYPCCKICTEAGREDLSSLLRSVVLRRDGFACATCGTDEGQLDVHHIKPDGSAWAWNLEILCVACWLTMRTSKAYGPLDELQWLDRALAYSTYLAEYLDSSERTMLDEQLRETLGSDMQGKPCRDRESEVRGLVNVLNCFGREGIVIEHHAYS